MVGSNLHAYFLTWNLSGFKKYLDGQEPVIEPSGGAGGSSGCAHAGGGKNGGKAASGPKSWTMHNLSQTAGQKSKADPNERDALGRTVLHLVCSTPQDPRSYEFLHALLTLPTINVNIQDAESGWTALHRAMWCGNLRAARELLSRQDTELGIKDAEGLTAMDLYNSTCEGTNPEDGARGTDLFTWGSNKNCTLGLGDPADRGLPERVNLLTQAQASSRADTAPRKGPQPPSPVTSDSESDEEPDLVARSKPERFDSSKFDQVGVNQVVLSRFHTAVVTSESTGNLSLCGFGGNARLGKPVHTQYALLPQTDLPYRIVSVALAQDHTLALTSHGFIMSWGQNRFAQLGYVIEPPEEKAALKAFAASAITGEDTIQNTPKRIVGPLKKEHVIGVAASRMCSACWTWDTVWTWGTNSGQLGYDKAANPVQVLPRKVTGISQPVRDLAMTDFAMACLLDTYEVLVYYADAYIRVNFPTQRFPSDFSVYRPPQFVAKPTITKITSCGSTFAALSSLGDVFSFSLQNPIDADLARDGRDKHITIKPQMVWALRKRFTAVKDVALGSDGTVIICTHSGHVYVRQRANKQWSFKRTPYLQRVIEVAANESGSFAAVRSDAVPSPIAVTGQTLGEDLLDILPAYRQSASLEVNHAVGFVQPPADEDEDEADVDIQRDGRIALRMALTTMKWDETFEQLSLGSDAWLEVGNFRLPIHLFLLQMRIPAIRHLLGGQADGSVSRIMTVKRSSDVPRLILKNCGVFSVLLLLQWVYSDELAAVWDSRVHSYIRTALPKFKLDVSQVKRELQNLVEVFDLKDLAGPLASTGKVQVLATLPKCFSTFWIDCQTADSWSSEQCDAVLKLSDRRVYCSSIVLRARSSFFDAMFDDPEWTSLRHNEDGHGRVVVNLEKHKWRSMRMVLQYMHDGQEDDIFDYRHQDTLDDFLDFVFEVIAVANELLMDRLVLVCSRVIRRHVNIHNASSLAAEATLHNAGSLKRSLFSYIACNLETMLENGLLDDMDIRGMNDLTAFVQDRQGVRLPITRSGVLEQLALERQTDWLGQQDIPSVRIRPNRSYWKAKSPKLSPVTPLETTGSRSKGKARAVPIAPSAPTGGQRGGDDSEIFSMEDEPAASDTFSLPGSAIPRGTPSSAGESSAQLSSSSPATPWKSKAVESQRVDMRSIMAEAEHGREVRAKPSLSSTTAVPTRPGIYTPPMLVASTPPRNVAAAAAPTQPAATPSAQSASTWRTVPGSGQSAATTTPVKQGPAPPSSAFPALGAVPRTPSTASVSRPSLLAQSRTSTPTPKASPSTRTSGAPGASPANKAPEVIVPTRGATQRRKTTEPAWSTAPVFQPAPVVPTVSPSPNGLSGQLSLLDIQRQELEGQRAGNQRTAPQSLVDIQAEERRIETERAAQMEFERWWQQEEARVAAEQRRLDGTGKAGGRGGGGGGGGKPRGRGRGGGGGGKARGGGAAGGTSGPRPQGHHQGEKGVKVGQQSGRP